MLFITNEQELSFQNKIQVIYFYASWMPFHKKMLLMIEKMEEKYKEINFFAIDADHFKGLCKRFSVKSIPTVIIMKDFNEATRMVGLVMTSAFKSAFVDICKN